MIIQGISIVQTQEGAKRLSGNAIPVTCEHCGMLFSSGFGVGGSATMHLTGVGSQCPHCNKMSSIPDGVYGLIDGVARAINGLRGSVGDLARIHEKTKEYKHGKIGRSEYLTAVESVSPELALVLKSTDRRSIIPLLFLILFLTNLINRGVDWTVSKVIDLVTSHPEAAKDSMFFTDEESKLRSEYEKESGK